MEMGASQSCHPNQIQEFPGFQAFFAGNLGVPKSSKHNHDLHTEKVLNSPLPIFFSPQFPPKILWNIANIAYIHTWSKFQSPKARFPQNCLHGIEQSRWTPPKVHFDPKEQHSSATSHSCGPVLRHFGPYSLLRSCYLWGTTCTSGNAQLVGKKNNFEVGSEECFLASIINQHRLETHLILKQNEARRA